MNQGKSHRTGKSGHGNRQPIKRCSRRRGRVFQLLDGLDVPFRQIR
jgi:hypothetical protein